MPKKPPEEESLEAPGYMMLYSTLMTLMMAFFIALTTMGTYGGEKFQKVVGSIREAFELFPPGGPGVFFRDMWTKGLGRPSFLSEQLRYDRSRLLAALDTKSAEPGKTGVHELRISYEDTNRFVVEVDNAVLFAPGQSRLSPSAYSVLERLIRLYRDQPFRIGITGYAGPVPAGGVDTAAWSLAVNRAAVIMQYLHRTGDISYDRLAAQGKLISVSADKAHPQELPRVEIELTRTEDAGR